MGSFTSLSASSVFAVSQTTDADGKILLGEKKEAKVYILDKKTVVTGNVSHGTTVTVTHNGPLATKIEGPAEP